MGLYYYSSTSHGHRINVISNRDTNITHLQELTWLAGTNWDTQSYVTNDAKSQTLVIAQGLPTVKAGRVFYRLFCAQGRTHPRHVRVILLQKCSLQIFAANECEILLRFVKKKYTESALRFCIDSLTSLLRETFFYFLLPNYFGNRECDVS